MNKYEKFVAEFTEIAAMETVSDLELVRFNVSSDYDLLSRKYIWLIRSLVAGIPKSRITIHEQWPENWWQAVRKRWFPSWWLERHPVKYRHIDVDQPIFGPVCPHSKLWDKTPHLEWMMQKEAPP